MSSPPSVTDQAVSDRESVIALRAAGVAVIVAVPPAGLPEILHWGVDPGDHATMPEGLAQLRRALSRQVSFSALDRPWPLTLLPTEHDGWSGRPGLAGHHGRRPLLPEWRLVSIETTSARLRLRAQADGLSLDTELAIDAAGVVEIVHSITNQGTDTLELSILEATMPVPSRAEEVLDLAGRWTRERTAQRRPLSGGAFTRESRRGRPGHDAPTLLVAGSIGFGDGHGEVWATHLAWSGDSVHRTDDLAEIPVSLIGCGELLRPGEVSLSPGETFRSPASLFIWSDQGLDGVSARLHDRLRGRPGHPSAPRPLYLNTWEAVYFDHDLERLREIARLAADVGVERFVIDDGWFQGRRDDTRALGDWEVDPQRWPKGLGPIVDEVKALGLDFGLWVEPEMVSPESQLARAHPDWLLGDPVSPPRTWRAQQVLDLANPQAAAYLIDRLSALVSEYGIAYLKWDHNRELLEALHDGRAGVDAQTRALYRLLDELRRRHPALEIESCASGGARIDLGILDRTDRVWASDTNDPIERLRIQRNTELLLPLELIGSHVGARLSHTTGRVAELPFQLATALFASPGLEMDLTLCTRDELDQLRQFAAAYRRLRPLLHGGRLWHSPTDDAGSELVGVVSPDRKHALYRSTRTATGPKATPPALRFEGLDPGLDYRVTPLDGLRMPRLLDAIAPPWLAEAPTLPGALLSEVGLRTPLLAPGQSLVLELRAVAS